MESLRAKFNHDLFMVVCKKFGLNGCKKDDDSI